MMSVDISGRLITERYITIAVGLRFISLAKEKEHLRPINLPCLIMEFVYIQFVCLNDSAIKVGTCR